MAIHEVGQPASHYGQYFREKNEKKARALPGYTYLRKIKIKVVVIHVRQLLILV